MDLEKSFELKEPIKSSEMPKSALFQPHPKQLLRGTHQRQLETIIFQLKLYHEPGYCWQGEWEDRMWCAQCINECEESDYLELQKCRSNEVKQHFTYEPMPDGIGGRIKPLSNTSLCWERTRARAHQLSPCDDITGIVNVSQIFRGVDMFKPFELHPYTRGDQTANPHGPMCLTSEHYPKRAEVLRAQNCVDVRLDKSSFWVAYNAYNEVGDTLLAPVEIQKEPPASSPTTLPSAAPSVPPEEPTESPPAPTIPPATIPPAAYTNEAVRWTIAPSESPGQQDEPTDTTESRKFPQ
jgi:hypothetical protein